MFQTMAIACMILGGEDPASPPQSPADRPPVSAAWQMRVESRYREFESLLSRMSQALAPTDPERAALLNKAFSESRRELVAAQLQEIVKKIEKGEFPRAIEDQEAALAAMTDILEILLDEDRIGQAKADRQNMEEQLQEAKRLSSQQRQLKERTQREAGDQPEDATKLAQEQKQLAESARQLAQKMKTKGESPENEPKQRQPAADKPNDPSEPPSAKDPQSQPSNSAEPSASNSMSQAEQAMRSAQKKLDDLKKKEATKDQDKAIDELEKTIQQLQEQIEQRREEERQELLAQLEARLKEIKQMQETILEGTVQIDKRPVAERTRTDEQRSLLLSKSENEVVAGLEQVLSLLVEDGTAVAFPETMEQLARDAEQVARELADAQTGPNVQEVQQDIIDTLAEMVAALDKAKGTKTSSSKESSPTGGKSGRHPLVEQLAELKMIRSLQLRINERTGAIEKTLSREGETSPTARRAIEELADRQHRVYEITRDIAGGTSP